MPPAAPQLDRLTILRSQTLTRLVQEEILRQIKAGELRAGTKLNEAEIAGRLDISRGPTREAFAALEEAGLLRLEKNRGAFIREISDREAAELYEVRRGLDETGGRLLASRITESQLDRLDTILRSLEDCADRGDVDAYFDGNIAFHDELIGMTGNVTLLDAYRHIVNRMHLLRRHGLSTSGANKESRAEHRMIVDALRRREPDAASFHMGNHVEQGYRRYLKSLEEDRTTEQGPNAPRADQ